MAPEPGDGGTGAAMTARGFVALCVKLIAVYYLVQTVFGFFTVGYSQMIFRDKDLGNLYTLVLVGVPAAMTLGLAWLIRKSDWVAGQFVNNDSAVGCPPVSMGQAQAVVFSALGLGLIISALGEIAPFIAYTYLLSRNPTAEFFIVSAETLYSNLIGTLLRLGCGVFLFLFPGRLVSVWSACQRQPERP
jgi:hypothetical protein